MNNYPDWKSVMIDSTSGSLTIEMIENLRDVTVFGKRVNKFTVKIDGLYWETYMDSLEIFKYELY